MSSRQLRKIQKQRELEQAEAIAENSSDASDEEPAPAQKPRASLFAALGGGDGGDDNDDESEPEEQKPQPEELPQPVSAGKSKKKKKNKKKKKAAKAVEPADDEDEIDRAMKELGIENQPSQEAAQAAAESQRANTLWSVNTAHLRADNEMERIFGREVISAAVAEENAEQQRNRRSRTTANDLETFLRGPPNTRKLKELSRRHNAFIQGRTHWPDATAGGLQLKEIAKREDGTEYAYEYDSKYDTAQMTFFQFVQLGDPMRMVMLLQEQPYHISTLIQVSMVAKQDQNMALSAELCERALFSFGRVANNAFRRDIEQGKARLDFRRPENRQIWLAGYHYIKSLIRKGTFRTALEWARLLYMFDPSDPYAMRHFIHFLAIRAREERWLVDFIDQLDEATVNRDTAYLRQTLVLAKLSLGDVDGAREEIFCGMRRVPWLYSALFSELNLDIPPAVWGIKANTDSRALWTQLYIYNAKDIWNNTQAIELLQDVANKIPMINQYLVPDDDSTVDLGTTRLVFLEGQGSLISLAPRELLSSHPNYEFDPIPPAKEDNIFTSAGGRLPWAPHNTVLPTFQARLDRLLARHARRQGVPQANVPGAEDDGDDDFEGLLQREEEELQRDMEQMRGTDNTGVIGQLMRLLWREGQVAEESETAEPVDAEEGTDNEFNVPGAWRA